MIILNNDVSTISAAINALEERIIKLESMEENNDDKQQQCKLDKSSAAKIRTRNKPDKTRNKSDKTKNSDVGE